MSLRLKLGLMLLSITIKRGPLTLSNWGPGLRWMKRTGRVRPLKPWMMRQVRPPLTGCLKWRSRMLLTMNKVYLLTR